MTEAKDQPMEELLRTDGLGRIRTMARRHVSAPEAQGTYLNGQCIGFHGIRWVTVEEKGSGYICTKTNDLVQARDTNFRPISLMFGPDGSACWAQPPSPHATLRVWHSLHWAQLRPLSTPLFNHILLTSTTLIRHHPEIYFGIRYSGQIFPIGFKTYLALFDSLPIWRVISVIPDSAFNR